MRTLTVISGPGAGESLEVDADVVIGREDADLTLSDSELSRRHAVVRPVDDGVEIEDLDSLNGTFVNGERIDEAVTLMVGGTIRVGKSELRIELDLPAATRMHPVEDAPVPSPPDVTRQRPVPGGGPTPDLDVTRQRPVPPGDEPPEPDVTAPWQSPPPELDVTRQRPVPPGTQPPTGEPPAELAVTAQRRSPTPPTTDAATAGPPGAPASDAPPGGPPGPAPPPRYGRPASGRPGPKRPPRLALFGLAVLMLAALAVVLLLVLGGNDTKKRAFRAQLVTGLLSQQGRKVSAGGTATASPGGKGTVLVNLVSDGNPRGTKPYAVSGTVVFRFDGGRIDSRFKGTATPTPQRTTDLAGNATIIGGTDEFEEAKGSYRYKSGQEPSNPTVGHPTITGSIEY